MYQQSLRAGAEASARQQGADDATVRAAGSSVVARHADRVTPFALEVNEASVVPHEIGHGWYVEAFWPGYSIEATGHYGRPGPDWLDEVAPILMESGDSAELRRSLFRDVYRAQGRGILADYPVADLIDLPRFLSRDHPTKAGSREKKNDATRTGAPVIKVVATDSEAQMASIREASLFYPQGRIFADFLLDRTGDPAVFGSIGDAFGRGETFEQWLAANGADKGLASTVPGLDRDWRQWLAGRFGAPGAG